MKFGPGWLVHQSDYPGAYELILENINSDIDLMRLFNAFGYKQHYLWRIPLESEWSLPQFITHLVNPETISSSKFAVVGADTTDPNAPQGGYTAPMYKFK